MLTLLWDMRRRRLSLRRKVGWGLFPFLDLCAVASVVGFGGVLLARTNYFFQITLSLIILAFVWHEGKKQVQLQRPGGIVFGEACVLGGIFLACSPFPGTLAGRFLPALAGTALLGYIVPVFLRGREEHRILDQLSTKGEFVQQEWVSPTLECPFPGRWKMFNAQSAELEVLDFLKALVTTVKPDLIVETGTFVGHSTVSMAQGLRQNGFGRIITAEFDPVVFAKADENIQESGLASWIDNRCASSLQLNVEGTIDLFYSDSEVTIREAEVRRFLPQIKEGGLILIHDANSSFRVVREAALKLEKEGLLSVLLLPTPRGLVVAQKRDGRK